jgi:hypothetical protein
VVSWITKITGITNKAVKELLKILQHFNMACLKPAGGTIRQFNFSPIV